jgi:D-serine deaminase-like pyridoxal phosphate-dependent protein
MNTPHATSVTSAENDARTPLVSLNTPCLVVDAMRMERNITRLRERLQKLGVSFRPHLKTAKSVDVSRRVMTTSHGPATVSTLLEAEVFAQAGITDMTYAVGIAPDKIGRIAALRRAGVDIAVVVDSWEQAVAVAAGGDSAAPIPVLIEIDCDGHRSGVAPDDRALLIEIATALGSGEGASLRGVLTHAGESYSARSPVELEVAAEQERAAVVQAAGTLRDAGFAVSVVSVGSTPTAHFAKSLDGVTEVRAGVFVFFDLVQAGIGACTVDDVALSVLTTVIGHQKTKGWTIVDAGWMAMSRDRGTAAQTIDQGYGIVCDVHGQPIEDLIVIGANQEHGIIAPRSGTSGAVPDFPIGTRLRILPNHACATGAQHDRYHVVEGTGDAVIATWPRFSGW